MKELPRAELEHLIAVPKYLADPARDLAYLQGRSRQERDSWGQRLQQVSQRYHHLIDSFAPDPYLEAYLALAQLKLSAVARKLGEPLTSEHVFSERAFSLLDRMEEFCILDRLSPQEVVSASGQSPEGSELGEIARLAAVMGLHLNTEVAADPELPAPLAFAIHRLYWRRLARAQEVARLYLEKHGLPKLVQEVERTCSGCQRLLLDADHVRALSSASLEVLIALAPPQQARLLAELARLKVMQGMTERQILAAAAERQPRALEAFKEIVAGAAATEQLEIFERLLQEVKMSADRQSQDYRQALESLSRLMEQSLKAVVGTAWAASGRGGPCPACEAASSNPQGV